MAEVPEVMPEKDYLFTVAEEVVGLVELLERPPKEYHGRSLNWHGEEVVNPAGVISSKDKYFLYTFGPSHDSGIGRHIDGWLYTRDSDGNLRELFHATTHSDKPAFLIAWPDNIVERRKKWVDALKEVGGEFGFYYGDREFDVKMLAETATDSVSLGKLADAYCIKFSKQ